eukprot:GILI01004271.1.p1 GENE.GILI01004271.1~~GILI01004271.1.p1  ORF type:complete len:270 (-),score=57.58 GILI01004271.1:78-836(-)
MANKAKIGEACEKILSFLSTSTVTVDTTASLFGAQKSSSDVRSVDVEITFLTAPETHRVPVFAVLPNEVHHGNICLVTPSNQDKYKAILEKSEDSPAASRVKKVIDVKTLAAQYSDAVTCRALTRSYEIFIVHNKVNKFPAQLTGEFVGHHHAPIWMPQSPNLTHGVELSLRTAVMPRRGFVSTTVTVGHTGLTAIQLAENVLAFSESLGEGSVLTLRLCGMDGKGRRAQLPFYSHNYIAEHPELTKAAKKK